jgi:hypothetical protein
VCASHTRKNKRSNHFATKLVSCSPSLFTPDESIDLHAKWLKFNFIRSAFGDVVNVKFTLNGGISPNEKFQLNQASQPSFEQHQDTLDSPRLVRSSSARWRTGCKTLTATSFSYEAHLLQTKAGMAYT